MMRISKILFSTLVGGAALCASAAWDDADARRGARAHGSVGHASGGFFGGRSAVRPRATLRTFRTPAQGLARAQRRYVAERGEFRRNTKNQRQFIGGLRRDYADRARGLRRANRLVLRQFERHGKASPGYRAAERRWDRANSRYQAARGTYRYYAAQAKKLYRHDRRQYRAAGRALGRATERYFRSTGSATPRPLNRGHRAELRPLRR